MPGKQSIDKVKGDIAKFTKVHTDAINKHAIKLLDKMEADLAKAIEKDKKAELARAKKLDKMQSDLANEMVKIAKEKKGAVAKKKVAKKKKVTKKKAS